ncbi:Transcription initiation factor TFIID subunit 8 [Candida viswanathii]|uniref:Transcription initiation factor TFIID subunit 8 n=1 Tax=Candida viswanathii TaxID=5486 RepID=A0A367YLP7_9ASCO|nr:Transcription initiation factor TFIID subunit 8 [Candida viswanathii]
MDLILEKTIGSILESKDYSYSREFLDQLTELSLQFIQDLTADLSTYTRIQRRHQPSLSDVKLLLKLKHIKNNDLIDEIEKSRAFPYSQKLSQLLTDKPKQAPDEDEDEDGDDQSRPFFEQSSIMQLLPTLNNSKPRYIPSYLPDLPPDYTYQSTPEYNQPLTDLKELRMKLVLESRMTEDSLYKLIENDEIEWRKKFEEELKEMGDVGAAVIEEEEKPKDEVQEVKEEPKQGVPTVPTKEEAAKAEVKEDFKFDIVEYAQKRKRLALKKEKKLEDHYKARENDIYMKAELYYSPYATKKPTAEINKYFQDIISDGFKEVIASVRKAEVAKQEKIKQLREEQARREKELQQQNEIAFNFPTLNQSESDESDDDADMEEELNFDVPEKPQEGERALVVVQNSDKPETEQPQQEVQQRQVMSLLPAATTETKPQEEDEIDLNLEDELNAHFGSMSPEPINAQEVSDISSEEGGADDDEEMEIVA